MADRQVNIEITAEDRASQVIKGVVSKLEGATKSIATMGKKMEVAGRVMQRIGRVFSVQLTAPIVAFGKSAVDAAVSVDTATRQLQKVFSGTARELKAELIPAAQELALLWGTNKIEIIDVMQELAAMGFQTQDIIDGTTRAVEVSKLGNLDLAASMDLVVAVMQNYGVRGKELTQTIADLNAVEDAGAARLSDMAVGLGRVASIAKLAGVDVKELGAFMSVLIGRGEKATIAARSLRTIISRILSPTKDITEAFDKLGIKIEKTESVTKTLTKTLGGDADEVERLEKKLKTTTTQLRDYTAEADAAGLSEEDRAKKTGTLTNRIKALNSQIATAAGVTEEYTGAVNVGTGELRDLDKVLIELAEKWADLDQVEQGNIATKIAGRNHADRLIKVLDDLSSKSMSEYLRIMGEVNDDQENLTRLMEQLGIESESAAVQFGIVKEKFRELKEFIGNDVIPIILKLANETIIPLINRFKNLDDATRQSAVKWAIFIAALGPFLIVAGSAVQILGFLFIALGKIVAGISLLAGVVGVSTIAMWGLVAIVVALVAAAIKLADHFGFLTTQSGKVRKAMENQKIAQDNLNRAMDEGRDASNSLERAKIRVERSSINLTAAQKNLVDMTDQYGSESGEAEAAALLLRDAQLESTEAEQGLTEATNIQREADYELMEQQDKTREAMEKTRDEIDKQKTGFEKLGDAIHAAWSKLGDWIKRQFEIPEEYRGFRDGGGMQHGGIVPGAIGEPVPILAHGGERITPRGSNVVAPFGGGAPIGGGGVTINMTGPIVLDSEERTRQLADRILKIMGRQNELSRYGTGF